MKNFLRPLGLICTLVGGVLLAGLDTRADDIDIFVSAQSGTSSGSTEVIFLLDNTTNCSRAAQKWPDQPTQGQAEVDAIVQTVAQITNPGAGKTPPNLQFGIAMHTLTPGAGGYIRFGVRDLTGNANRTAFNNILGYGPTPAGAPASSIYNNIDAPSEKINVGQADHEAALYEVYKYFKGLSVFNGTPAGNSFADIGSASGPETAKGQGLTSGFALSTDGKTYTPPQTTSGSCAARQVVIYIANNMQKGSPFPSSLTYENTYAGPALKPDPNAGSFSTAMFTREWVRFLQRNGIATYILDAYNAQSNGQYSQLLIDAAAQSGSGHYFQVGSEQAIINALTKILIDIQAVNSTFTAASLPASATNRSVNQNEVFLGVFRPTGDATPRWYGNLKRLQLIPTAGGGVDLGDMLGNAAGNSQTGFIADCSASYWNSDTSNYPLTGVPGTTAPYWSLTTTQPVPSSLCAAPGTAGGNNNPASNPSFAPSGGATWSPLSDLPDGPFVEKGGVAEILRRGNVASNVLSTWKVNRTIKTLSGSTLTDFATLAPGLALASLGVPAVAPAGVTLPTSGQLTDFVMGWDSLDENSNGYTDPSVSTSTETRPSIHGDVIHSTPLPITYGDGSTVIYYGANDGMYRAVDAGSGRELWSFVAPEFFSRLYRLYANSPLIAYPNLIGQAIAPTPTWKDYFFDGTTGIYQSADNKSVWIYPSMRRGGRMIYAFDVSPSSGTAPTSPKFLWKAGCPDLGDNVGCTSGMSAIGQTWSTPQSALIKNGPTDTSPAPLLVFGGGYDSNPTTAGGITFNSCDDANQASPACPNRKGSVIYFIDAQNGPSTLLKAMPLPNTNGAPGSIVGDIALLDVNGDGFVDYAFASDTNGFVYRVDFVDGPLTRVPLKQSDWKITQIAGTQGSGRKFLFGPALVLNMSKVFIAIGTGDREHPLISEYPYTSVVNRFYVFINDLASTSYLNLDGNSMNDATGATCMTTPVLPATAPMPSGWFLPLNQNGPGEQVVTPAEVISGQVTWGTNRPTTASANTCSNSLGEARGYLVDLLNGSGAIDASGVCGGSVSSAYIGGGLPPPPRVGIVPITDSNGNTVYKGVCMGCPSKSTTGISPIQPVQPLPGDAEIRRRVFWSTPTSN